MVLNAIFWAIIIGIGIWQSKPKPLTIAFIISLYVGLGVYTYVRGWISYLPTSQIFMFYGIPIGLFFLTALIFHLFTKTDEDTPSAEYKCWYVGAIVSVLLTLPTVFLFYDWQEARLDYEEEMEELFGDEWEDELEEMEDEAIFRRR